MRKKKVLIIDDEQDFCMLLKGFFQRKNYEVYLSYTLNDGMQVLENVEPDFVFLDNNLPDGLGWSKTEYILGKYPNVQLNLISAYYVPRTNASIFRILEKPLNIADLDKLFA